MADVLANPDRPCANISGTGNDVYELNNLNHLAAERNASLVMWDWIDTATDHTDAWSDQLDLTLEEFFEVVTDMARSAMASTRS